MGEDSKSRNLERLLGVTRKMAATTDLQELLGTIVDATCEVLCCDRATIFLYDRDTHQLVSRVATGDESIRCPADRGIAGAAATERTMINVVDAYGDARFNRDVDKQTGYRTRNLLTFPLENLDGELMGVLQALNKHAGPFDAADEALANTLAAQAGVALHRQRLLDEYAEKQRMARDLELARRIQQQLFPKENPRIEGYEVAGWNQCADETGGDCYDFMPLADGRIAILLADATGHGIPAALIIAQCRSLVRAMLSMTDDLRAVAARVNRLLASDLSDDRFVTAFVGILDPGAHRLDYIAAGQGPLLLVWDGGSEQRSASGLPFAVLDESDCDVERFELAPGATAVLLTDGFYEAESPEGTPFGEERVLEVVQRCADLPLTKLIAELHAEIRRFTRGAPAADDLTAVFIRRAY